MTQTQLNTLLASGATPGAIWAAIQNDIAQGVAAPNAVIAARDATIANLLDVIDRAHIAMTQMDPDKITTALNRTTNVRRTEKNRRKADLDAEIAKLEAAKLAVDAEV